MTGNGNHVTPLLFGKIREMTLGKFNLLLDGYKPLCGNAAVAVDASESFRPW
jgi:hypothetical protein